VDGGIGWEEEMFLQKCEQGQIYQALSSPADDRNRIKRRLLCAFYRNPREESRFPNAMWARLSRMFPAVAMVLTELKRTDYRCAAWLMQNLESMMFIHRVCGRIKRERPDVPLLTKHDSIGTVPQHVEFVEAVIRDEFLKLGVEVHLKKETYS
jgi:hypothetical protein